MSQRTPNPGFPLLVMFIEVKSEAQKPQAYILMAG